MVPMPGSRPFQWSSVGIMANELVSIHLCHLGSYATLSLHHFRCDNESLVAAINKSLLKNAIVMHLLCFLWAFIAHFNIFITASNLLGEMK